MWRLLPLIIAAGCTCSSPEQSTPEPVPHFDEWGRLVNAAAKGDAFVARTVARDLMAAPEFDSAELGSALGFLQIAQPEELPAGVAAAAMACGACHLEQSVSAPKALGKTHEFEGVLAAFGVLWPAEPLGEEAESGLQGIVEACQECHMKSAEIR